MSDIDFLLKRYRDDVLKPGSRGFEEMRKRLINPLHVTNSALLPEEHPLKIQGYIILDAFESVTNGMENPQALGDLETIDHRSVFYPWKLLVLGLKAFYSGDDTTCRQLLGQIPQDCDALHRLASDFIKEIYSPHKRFFKEVWSLPPVFRDTLEQLEASATVETQDIFLEILEESTRLWQKQQDFDKIVFGTWVIRLTHSGDLDLRAVIRSLMKTLGLYCAEQSVALALYRESIETAVLFYARSLLDKQEPITFEERTLLREMYRQTVLYQQDAGIDDDFEREWTVLSTHLGQLGITFSEPSAKRENKRDRSWKKHSAQLDLFAS